MAAVLELRLGITIVRVPSDASRADLPSRGKRPLHCEDIAPSLVYWPPELLAILDSHFQAAGGDVSAPPGAHAGCHFRTSLGPVDSEVN